MMTFRIFKRPTAFTINGRKSLRLSSCCSVTHFKNERRQAARWDVIRTAPDIEAALSNLLPDLVVHWEAEVFSTPLKVYGIALESHLVGKKFTGQHAPYGFCVWEGHGAPRESTGMQASEFHRFIEQALRDG